MQQAAEQATTTLPTTKMIPSSPPPRHSHPINRRIRATRSSGGSGRAKGKGHKEQKRGEDVLYLAAHGEEEKDEEVDDEDRPVHGHVEHLEEGRKDRDYGCARR